MILRRKPTHQVLAESYTVTDSGCWQWSRALNYQGYGILWRGNRAYFRAHVASYELHVGPVPEGAVLDHACRNRACINPDHLEPVTNRENVLRGIGPSAVNARKRKCKRGHEFTPENTHIDPNGWRVCRICRSKRKEIQSARALSAPTEGADQ